MIAGVIGAKTKHVSFFRGARAIARTFGGRRRSGLHGLAGAAWKAWRSMLRFSERSSLRSNGLRRASERVAPKLGARRAARGNWPQRCVQKACCSTGENRRERRIMARQVCAREGPTGPEALRTSKSKALQSTKSVKSVISYFASTRPCGYAPFSSRARAICGKG